MIYLTDDGTLDTVLKCSECGEEMRYNFDTHHDECNAVNDGADCDCYDNFIDWAIEDAAAEHECRVSE